jgi:hypothetical protein
MSERQNESGYRSWYGTSHLSLSAVLGAYDSSVVMCIICNKTVAAHRLLVPNKNIALLGMFHAAVNTVRG